MTAKDIVKEVAQIGREYRAKNDLTRTEHARRVGMHTYNLERIDAEEETVKLSTLVEYASFHGVTLNIES